MKVNSVNEKAHRILIKTFWSSRGWRDDRSISGEDFAYARDAGYMFDPMNLTHDEIIQWARQSFDNLKTSEVSDAFLASLSTRRLELRSALGSCGVARNLPIHSFVGHHHCEICGLPRCDSHTIDRNVLNFERYKWGGVRHLDPRYIAFDLSLLPTIEPIHPSQKDYTILRNIIDVVHRLHDTVKPSDLVRELAPVLQSNKDERRILLQLLAYCGVLQPVGRTGFFRDFTNWADRTMPPVHTIDWEYPIWWWRGRDGFDEAALKYYFPQI